MSELPRGLIAPNLTPFEDDLSVATDLYVAHARRLLDQGCGGLAPFGTTGEALSVGIEERIEALGALVKAGVPTDRLIPGTGVTSLPDTICLSRACLDLGCAAVLVLPPFYYKGVSEEGLHAWFAGLVQALGAEARILLYHIPRLSGVDMPASLVARLSRDFPGRILGIKDSSGDSATLARLQEIAGLAVYPGTELLLPEAVARGAQGCISASANVNAPALSEHVAALTEGRQDDKLAGHVRAVRLALQSTDFISGQKRLLAIATGDARWANVRPPLMPMPADEGRRMLDALEPHLRLPSPA